MSRQPSVLSAKSGISLVEVMLCLVMMAVIIIPATIMMAQTQQANQGSFTQANRSNLINTLAAQVQPNHPFLANYMDNASQLTTYKEPNATFTGTRQTIPYMSKQAATSNALNRQYNLYVYNQGAAVSSPRIATMVAENADELRVIFGIDTSLFDSSLRKWGPGAVVYNASLKSYGTTDEEGSSWSNTASTEAVNLYNPLDFWWSTPRAEAWSPHTISYDFDVPNGAYTVQLLFQDECDDCGRQMNITIEGQKMNASPYDPRAVTGGINRMHILAYDTYVWDSKLSVQVAQDASNLIDEAICTGMVILRRDLP